MEVDFEEFPFEEGAMGEDWKDKLDELMQENTLNQIQRNDVQLPLR